MNWEQASKAITKLSGDFANKPYLNQLLKACAEWSLAGIVGGIEALVTSHYSFFILGYAAAKYPEIEAMMFSDHEKPDLNNLFGGNVVVGDDNGN